MRQEVLEQPESPLLQRQYSKLDPKNGDAARFRAAPYVTLFASPMKLYTLDINKANELNYELNYIR